MKSIFAFEYPHWMDSTYFTVNATIPDGATQADVPVMMQHLLEERFGLKFHRESRQMTGYELIVAKSGPRLLRRSAPDSGNSTSRGPQIEIKNGEPQFSKDAHSGQLFSVTAARWRGRNKTMKELAADIAANLRVPVIDATDLEGGYDYDLVFSPQLSSGLTSTEMANGATASVPSEHPQFRDALREQLGLELRTAKNIPIDVVVIDSARKEPTEN